MTDPKVSKPRLAMMGALALAIMAPVTLPVPVLRSLVGDRFEVSELLTSLFMSVNMVGAAIAAPLAGALADRLGRRRPLVIGALLADAACFAAMTLDMPFTLFMSLRFLEGCAHIFALSLLLSIAASLGGVHGRGLTMGITGTGMMLGVALGAPLGGVLGRNDTLLPLLVGAGLLVAAALLAWLTLLDPRGHEQRPGLSAIARAVRAHRAVIAPLIFAFADRFTVGFYTTTFSLFASGLHGATPPQVGLWISAFMLPFALFSFPFGVLADRVSKTALLCGGSAIYGLLTASLGFWSTEWIAPGMAVIGLSAALMFVPSMLMTADLTPPEIRSTAMGAFNAAGSLGFILGPMTGGLVSETVRASHGAAVGYQAAFVVAGIAEIACAALALPFLLRMRALGRTS
ncbi:MAG: MFS transporter [Deltaproteobacteria bacterium]|nr:MFS transporter [Deltaproteobacteria bacterium]MBW2495968.1 MFS transporter [Deltaproteobacteria bacterium]